MRFVLVEAKIATCGTPTSLCPCWPLYTYITIDHRGWGLQTAFLVPHGAKGGYGSDITELNHCRKIWKQWLAQKKLTGRPPTLQDIHRNDRIKHSLNSRPTAMWAVVGYGYDIITGATIAEKY